jgi:hypothetical protein
MLSAHDGQRRQVGRARRPVAVELRPTAEPPSDEELRRREQELERLIIKAACLRAARLAEQAGAGRAADRPPTGLEG